MDKFFTMGNELQGYPYFEGDLEQREIMFTPRKVRLDL